MEDNSSEAQVVITGIQPGDDADHEEVSEESIRDQDRFLPVANVGRVMRNQLPPNSKISKDAKELMQECASEFISFLTSEAIERCLLDKRRTLNGEDLLNALNTLGFDNYVGTLKLYLQMYRENDSGKGANKHPECKIEGMLGDPKEPLQAVIGLLNEPISEASPQHVMYKTIINPSQMGEEIFDT